MERLTERNEYGTPRCRDIPQANTKSIIEMLCNFEELQEQNRLIELPIGIGTTGFLICNTGVVIPAIVSHITLNDNKFCTPIIKFRSPYTGGICGHMPLDKVNKLFFKTRELAELAKNKLKGE